ARRRARLLRAALRPRLRRRPPAQRPRREHSGALRPRPRLHARRFDRPRRRPVRAGDLRRPGAPRPRADARRAAGRRRGARERATSRGRSRQGLQHRIPRSGLGRRQRHRHRLQGGHALRRRRRLPAPGSRRRSADPLAAAEHQGVHPQAQRLAQGVRGLGDQSRRRRRGVRLHRGHPSLAQPARSRCGSSQDQARAVADHYSKKGFNVWGKDKRYVVNALVWVNQQAQHNAKGPSGISKEAVSDDWYTSQSTAGVYIWLPGVDFMNAIYEKVAEHGGGTGSITADLWRTVKKIGHWAAYGLAFVGGLLHGFVKSLWDAVAGLVTMAKDVLVSIFTGS